MTRTKKRMIRLVLAAGALGVLVAAGMPARVAGSPGRREQTVDVAIRLVAEDGQAVPAERIESALGSVYLKANFQFFKGVLQVANEEVRVTEFSDGMFHLAGPIPTSVLREGGYEPKDVDRVCVALTLDANAVFPFHGRAVLEVPPGPAFRKEVALAVQERRRLESAEIIARLVSSATGRPLADYRLRAAGKNLQTDADGRFSVEIRDVSAVAYVSGVKLDGLPVERLSAHQITPEMIRRYQSDHEPITLQTDKPLAVVTLMLESEGEAPKPMSESAGPVLVSHQVSERQTVERAATIRDGYFVLYPEESEMLGSAIKAPHPIRFVFREPPLLNYCIVSGATWDWPVENDEPVQHHLVLTPMKPVDVVLTVVDAHGGEPIPGASVRVRAPGREEKEGRTDDQGHVRFAGVWPEQYRVLVRAPAYDEASLGADFSNPEPPPIALRRLVDVSITLKGPRAVEAARIGLALREPGGRLRQYGTVLEKDHREATVQAVPQGPAFLIILSEGEEVICLEAIDTSERRVFEAVCDRRPVVEFLLNAPGAPEGAVGIQVVDAEYRLPMRRLRPGPEMRIARLELAPRRYEVYAETPKGWVLLSAVDLTGPEAKPLYEFTFDPSGDHQYMKREEVYSDTKR
ncbi:MAG TPA: carboxypeptidase-like regulatory domain-containing protein [Phycisphaerae bacterium]|nr:carboxypeptidase-like regulatory domain-containing protein [Phycisphaerae bacterium]